MKKKLFKKGDRIREGNDPTVFLVVARKNMPHPIFRGVSFGHIYKCVLDGKYDPADPMTPIRITEPSNQILINHSSKVVAAK